MTIEEQTFFDGRIILKPGDCRDRIKGLADNSVDAVVTDPPYALESIVKRFGGKNAAPAQFGTDGAFARQSRGFMGMTWDTGEVAFDPTFWAEVWRVLKPGGYLVAFSGTRTYHRMAVAIDDAGFVDPETGEWVDRGFEIRDQGAWCYGSGMPHGLNAGKAVDKHLGAEREKKPVSGAPGYQRTIGNTRPWMEDPDHMVDGDTPASPEGAEWDGWNTNLKPAWEPICIARKPLAVPDGKGGFREATVAENLLYWGTGAINVRACKIEAEKVTGWSGNAAGGGTWTDENSGLCKDGDPRPSEGRYPANIITDGSPEVFAAFPNTAGGGDISNRASPKTKGIYGAFKGEEERFSGFGDNGSAARFFYSAKADGEDRLGSLHPTVKPVDLMRWLVRLVCRKGGVVLDPFAGTGTTGAGAYWEGCDAILIEREPAYQADIAKRMGLILAGPDEKKRARTKLESPEGLPLFSSL